MSVYSNFDHILEGKVVKQLKENIGTEEHHAAWNFSGRIKWDGEQWNNKIMRHGSEVEIIRGKEIMDVINEANDKYGHQ